MRWFSFEQGNRYHVGLRREDGAMVDITAIYPEMPYSLKGFLALGKTVLADIAQRAARVETRYILEEDGLRYAPLLPDAGKILCVGLNYADHAAEGRQAVPEHPVFFTRYPSSFVGHEQPLVVPRLSEKFDYEAELAVVIGERCRHLSKAEALGVVAGYTLCNDGSVRDYQKRTPQWTLGKNFDASGALGPELVMAHTLPDGAKGLAIRSRLNGQVMQEDRTDHMLFDVASLIAALTEVMTLEPGDVISTGTPAGVGFARDPKVWMKAGDVIEVEVEGIGVLRNPVVNE